QGQTDNSWGPRAIGDHGAPVSLPELKKAYEKGTRGISWGPLLTPDPRAVPEFPNGQSTPGPIKVTKINMQSVIQDSLHGKYSSPSGHVELPPFRFT
ncbi:unnamed protein product, partial [Staurois parvus]